MDVVGLVLAVLGILLTIVLSDRGVAWLRERAERRRWSAQRLRQQEVTNLREYRTVTEQWAPAIQVEQGLVPIFRHYGYESWLQLIAVDDEGNATHTVRARIVNLGADDLTDVCFPLYCDATNVPESEVHGWAAVGRRKLTATLEKWDMEKARGRLRIHFDPPIAPGCDCLVRWGYTLPSTFREGEEYYNWDVASEHFELCGELRFTSTWLVSNPRWDEPLSQTQPAPQVVGSSIRWKVRFPKAGSRCTMRFRLAKPRSSTP